MNQIELELLDLLCLHLELDGEKHHQQESSIKANL